MSAQQDAEHASSSMGDMAAATQLIMESLLLVDPPSKIVSNSTVSVNTQVTAGSIGDYRILVTSRSLDRVKEFLPDWTSRKYFYVYRADQLMGIPRGSIMMLIADYYRNPLFPDIRRTALERGMRFVVEMDPDQI